MKRYYNKTTGEWYIEGRSLTLRVDNIIFSGIPTEEQLLKWGFVEYIEPPYIENSTLNRMNEILAELQSMDYLTSKYIDGEDMTKYGDWQERRKALREEYNNLQNSMNNG